MIGYAPARWTPSRRACLALVLALLALHWLWYAQAAATPASGELVFTSLLSLPLVLLGVGLALGRPSARFWSGVAALFYFCHGIAEAWAIPESRMEGLAETLLSVALVVASSWDGLQARFGARRRRNV
jgi:uncharacterized membrane protein